MVEVLLFRGRGRRGSFPGLAAQLPVDRPEDIVFAEVAVDDAPGEQRQLQVLEMAEQVGNASPTFVTHRMLNWIRAANAESARSSTRSSSERSASVIPPATMRALRSSGSTPSAIAARLSRAASSVTLNEEMSASVG